MKQTTPEVSVIIANYNGEKFLKTCIDAVLGSSFRNFEVILTDDGSTDASKHLIDTFKKKDDRIHLVINEKNLGAAASRNKAVPLSRGKYLLFLDNDTEIKKDCISRMVETLKRDAIGACQALLLDFEKRELIQNAGVSLWSATGWGLPKYQWQEYKKLSLKERNIVAITAGMMVKKNVFEKVKGFDEQEAVVTEDLDFSWRVWLAGYRIVLSPEAIIYHMTKSVEKRKNMKHTSGTIYFHLTKNSLMSTAKNYEIGNAFRYFLESLFISFGRSLLVAFRRKDFSALSAFFKAIFFVTINFRKILQRRSYTQSIRKYSDKELFETIIERGSLFTVYTKFFKNSGLL